MLSLTRVALIVALCCIVSSAAARPMPTDVRCAFDVYTPILVMPFAFEEDVGPGLTRAVHGARVFVAAKPGLTERGLMTRLHREIAQPPSSPLAEQCRPDVRHVEVSVFAGDGGFWVELSASGERSAASVVRWAQRGLLAARDVSPALR